MIIKILLFGLMYFMMMIGSFIFHVGKYRYYRKIYRSLKDKKFVRIGVFVHSLNEEGSEFVWIIDKNSFLLNPKVGLMNMPLTFFDLYSFYWLIKYQRWCKKNINLETIETFKC